MTETLPKKKAAEQYGRIEIGRDGLPTARWEARALTTINTPFAMHLGWDRATVVRKIRVHRAACQALANALHDCSLMGANWLDLWGINVFGGCYAFKMKEDGRGLSPHSWGLAIDLSPERNPLGQKWDGRRNMIPKEAVEIFAKHSFIWGGDFEVPVCGKFVYQK